MLFLLNIMSLKFTHADGCHSSLFVYCVVFHCMKTHTLFICPPADGYLGWCQFGAIVNSVCCTCLSPL